MVFAADNQSFVRNAWYLAMPSRALKAGKTVGKVFLNEPILFGRTSAGKVFALRDLCPHRAMPLSCGWFDGETVQCSYHGWRFDDQGQCLDIPSLMADQQLDLKRFNVCTYEVQELQGNVWVYLPDPEKEKARPPRFDIPRVPGFSDDTQPNITYTMQVPCFADNAVVGLIDPAHTPYVHQSWWWRDTTVNPEIKWLDPSPGGFTIRRHKMANMGKGYWLIGGVPENEIVFSLPGVRSEETTTPRHRVVNFIAITPISEDQTEFTFEFYWDLPWGWILKPALHLMIRNFLAQDRGVLIKQHQGLKYDPILRLVKDADVPVRWYYQLKAEHQRSHAENRDFVSPVKTQQLRWMA